MNVLLSTLCAPDDRKTLAIARALRARGVRVYVGSDQFYGQAYWSRSVAGRIRLPHPGEDEAGYANQLISAADKLQLDIVIPTRVATTQALAHRASQLSPQIRFAVPPMESQRIAANKLLTTRLAERIGLHAPRTECPGNQSELERIALDMPYPVAVKPILGEGGIGFWIARNRAQLLGEWNDDRPGVTRRSEWGNMLVQEYIPGPVYDACGLFGKGEPCVVLTQKRLAVYPASGGVGVICETTEDPELAAAAVRILRELEWHGPAQVEFKRSAGCGRLVLMEINGRLWGTTDLAIQAGSDFPWYLCQLASGEAVPKPHYQKGLRYRWPLPFGLLIAMESGHGWKALSDFFGPADNTMTDLRWDDPLPLMAEGFYTLCRMWQRRSWRPMRA